MPLGKHIILCLKKTVVSGVFQDYFIQFLHKNINAKNVGKTLLGVHIVAPLPNKRYQNMSQCPNFNCYIIVFEHFGLCSCTKLVLRDAAFEMQLTFHVYGSRIRRSPFVCTKPKTIFIEPSYSYYQKQSLRSSSDGVH